MIENFLKESLANKEKVSLPDFGTFSTEASNAQLNEQEGIYTPPHRKIEFIAEVPYSDEDSIVNYIAENSHYTRESAEQEATDFVRKLKNQISTSNYAEIEGFGYFKKNGPVEMVSFHPFEESTELPESFGLPKLKVNPLTPAINPRTGQTQKKEEKILWWILVPIIVLTAGLIYIFFTPEAKEAVFAFNPFDSKEEIINNDPEKDSIQNSSPTITPVDSLPTKPDSIINTKPIDEKPKIKEVIVNTPSPNNDGLFVLEKTRRYYLAIGSFSSKDNAIKGAKKAKAAGYSGTRIVEAKENLFRLSIGDYATKKEALEKIEEAKKDYSGVWLFRY